MRLHTIQHVPFEGAANIGAWAEDQGWEVSATHIYRLDKLPDPDLFDWLVVMGGPMNIYEESEYPWLAAEKKFIGKTVEKGKVVIGVCLGAQLVADVLGGRVTRNAHKEIGWFPVSLTPEGEKSVAFQGLPNRFQAFHWHGDTFSLPPGAVMLAESEACAAQAFSANGGRVLALQFHLESSVESIRAIIQNSANELVDGKYIQGADAMLGNAENFASIRGTMSRLLENMKTSFSNG